MIRYLLLLAALLIAAPARADDISAAGRSVVRVVVVALEDGEPVGFGHGSGFAIAPNLIVTNAHVVAQAAPEGVQVAVGVVPSEGSQAFRARVVTIDPARDLALVEVSGARFTPLPLYTGPLDDGTQVTALGYPGNVDLATAQSANDYITPLPPTRSVGIFSNVRPINGITTLLHTANIARGNSGGPLLDACGRVLGVNTLITRNQEGDSSFAFAVANRELVTFLQAARQSFPSIATPCISMAERQSLDRDRASAAAQAAEEAALRDRDARQRALLALTEARENRMGLAALLLALGLIALGSAGVLLARNRNGRLASTVGSLGALLIVGAVAVFVTRPSFASLDAAPEGNETAAAPAPQARFVGRNICRLVPDRSRVTVSSTEDVPIDWAATGCVNGRTQYAQNGEVWSRTLVPESEPAVSVLEFNPGNGDYVVTRYQLGGEAIDRIRTLRRDVDIKSCGASPEQRTILADRQREIGAVLPRTPNERLVYTCTNQAPARAGS